jgi:hypothetical protein
VLEAPGYHQTATALASVACGAILPGQHIQVQPTPSVGIVRDVPFEHAEGCDGRHHLPETAHRANPPSAEYGDIVSINTAVSLQLPHPRGSLSSV